VATRLISQKSPELLRHFLKLVKLLLIDFPGLHQLHDLRFRVSLKTRLKLSEILYHLLKLSHLAAHAIPAELLK
jgi:hypothetical protein